MVIQGKFHSGGTNFSAVLAIAVHSLVLTGNQCYRNRCTNDALIETGTDADLFNVQDVTMTGNSGWYFSTLPPLPTGSRGYGDPNRFTNGGLIKLMPAPLASEQKLGMRFYTWYNSDSVALYPRRNLARAGTLCTSPGAALPCVPSSVLLQAR